MKARLPEGFGNKGMGNVMKQAQKMQEEMARIQTELEETEFTAAAGGGAVEITMNGKREVLKLEIKPEVVDPEDVEMLEDLVIAATNEVLKQIETKSTEEMEKATGGLSLPGLF